jgi:small GTP-binding protein
MEGKEKEINYDDAEIQNIIKEQLANSTLGLRALLLGDEKVGKTQIINKNAHNKFDAGYGITMSTEIINKEFSIDIASNTLKFKLSIWDLHGSQTYRNRLDLYCKQVDAFVFVYDITNKESFNNIQAWLDLAKNNNTKEALYFLVGNKADMDDEDGKRQVTTDEALDFAEKNNMRLIEVSAFNGQNINELFDQISKECANKHVNDYIKNIVNTKITTNPSHKIEYNNDNLEIPTHSKNKRCDCCPCCNKDEDDKNEEIISIKPMFNQLN